MIAPLAWIAASFHSPFLFNAQLRIALKKQIDWMVFSTNAKYERFENAT